MELSVSGKKLSLHDNNYDFFIVGLKGAWPSMVHPSYNGVYRTYQKNVACFLHADNESDPYTHLSPRHYLL